SRAAGAGRSARESAAPRPGDRGRRPPARASAARAAAARHRAARRRARGARRLPRPPRPVGRGAVADPGERGRRPRGAGGRGAVIRTAIPIADLPAFGAAATRTLLVRIGLAVALVATLAVAFLFTRSSPAHDALLPSGTSPVVVLDLSWSTASDY